MHCYKRFKIFLVAYLSYKYGAKIGPLLEKSGTKWTTIIAGIIIIIGSGIYFLFIK